MRRAKEESHFDRKNRELLERLAARKAEDKPRLSPVTGKPMEQVHFGEVIVDRCNDSGGIWLDAGELELLINQAADKTNQETGWLNKFLGAVKK